MEHSIDIVCPAVKRTRGWRYPNLTKRDLPSVQLVQLVGYTFNGTHNGCRNLEFEKLWFAAKQLSPITVLVRYARPFGVVRFHRT